MQSRLLPPAVSGSTLDRAPGEQVNESVAIARAVCASYVCERCGAPCDARTFSTAICPACQWRVLQKVACVKTDDVGSGGSLGTD
jgi:DNA-directed RNA polymerase subunit RPC12/RpoP